MVRQLAAVLGLVVGLSAAGWVGYAVGLRWHDAEPTVAFWALRWIVVVAAALAVAALISWMGDVVGGLVQATPLAWVDRPVGFLMGSVIGVTLATVLTALALLAPWPPVLHDMASQSAFAPPLMSGSAWVCSLAEGWVPGSGWLEQTFLAALERIDSIGRVV